MKPSNGVSAARWNTNPVHKVGFLDYERPRRFSELLAAAAEYFAELERDPEAHYVVDGVNYRRARDADGTPIFEVRVMERPADEPSWSAPEPLCSIVAGLRDRRHEDLLTAHKIIAELGMYDWRAGEDAASVAAEKLVGQLRESPFDLAPSDSDFGPVYRVGDLRQRAKELALEAARSDSDK